jgi:hypothetical protein
MAEEAPEPWVPLNLRQAAGGASDYEALVDGVPDYLERSLWRWVMDQAAAGGMALVYRIERKLRVSLHKNAARDIQPQTMIEMYWATCSETDRLVLIDFLLHDLDLRFERVAPSSVEKAVAAREARFSAAVLAQNFTEAGSLWRVVTQPLWGIERRVNEASQHLSAAASSGTTDAARKVASAWNSCYKPQPDYSAAYRDAVLAVEAAVLPVAIPADSSGTLGKAIAHIANTVEKWTVGDLDTTKQSSGQTLLAMLQTLWTNQARHAAPDGTIRDVSQQEAETAVSLAVTLVHWFTSGAARRKTP